MKNEGFSLKTVKIFGVIILALLLLTVGFLIGHLQGLISTTTAPTPPPSPPALDKPDQQATVPLSDVVTIINKWHELYPSNPGPAITALNELWDSNAADGQLVGQQWDHGPFTITVGPKQFAIFWTGPHSGTLEMTNPDGTLVPLYVQGAWGIYGAWNTNVVCNSPGRSMWPDRALNPEVDFPWWGN